MNLDYQGPFGNTLLHSAVISGDLREVKRLLAAGADPRIRNREGHTALRIAELAGQVKAFALLSAVASKVRRTPR